MNVTFKIPTPYVHPCCEKCRQSNRVPVKGLTFPVKSIEDAPEVAGKKRVTIIHDCGETSSWSILYFT